MPSLPHRGSTRAKIENLFGDVPGKHLGDGQLGVTQGVREIGQKEHGMIYPGPVHLLDQLVAERILEATQEEIGNFLLRHVRSASPEGCHHVLDRAIHKRHGEKIRRRDVTVDIDDISTLIDVRCHQH
jgi:hypothetical protein